MERKNNEKLQRMFDLQQKLNDETNGPAWKSGITQNGKLINWNRCIYMEAAEFIDSFQWKHWKNINAEADIENAKIELVDIWHFLLSEMLRADYSVHAAIVYKNIIAPAHNKIGEVKSQEEIIAIVEALINEATRKKPQINTLLISFFDVCVAMDLSFDELYIKYLGKNILNQFRQDNGYKDGSYIKIWNGREDNVVMLEIIQANSEFANEEILSALGREYEHARAVGPRTA